MEFLRGKSVPQLFFCFLPHLHDLHISAGVLQIICGIVDQGLLEFLHQRVIRVKAGADKGGSPVF